MKYKRLGLKNFKRFENASFNINDITILTGANSSGKSTFLKALTTIIQSCEHRMFPIAVDFNSDLTKLGSYRDIVYGLDTKKPITIEADIENGKSITKLSGTYRYVKKGNLVLPKNSKYETEKSFLEIDWKNPQSGYRGQSKTRFHGDEDFKKFKEVMTALFETTMKTTESTPQIEKDSFDADELINRMKGTDEWEQLKSKKPDELFREMDHNPSFTTFTTEIERINSLIINKTNYVAPIRAHPQRQYYVNSYEPKADPAGENSYQIIQYWKAHNKEKFEKLIEAVRLLQLASQISINNIKGNLIENTITPYGLKNSNNLVDVGFGLSQALPLLISDIQLQKNSVLLINQPEVHLHPSSQALLANYFSKNISQRQYIIETHSEYIINRFRLLCAKEKINPKRITIYFFSNRDSDFIHEIEINKDGSLKGAPDEFFETYQEDTFELAMSGFDND